MRKDHRLEALLGIRRRQHVDDDERQVSEFDLVDYDKKSQSNLGRGRVAYTSRLATPFSPDVCCFSWGDLDLRLIRRSVGRPIRHHQRNLDGVFRFFHKIHGRDQRIDRTNTEPDLYEQVPERRGLMITITIAATTAVTIKYQKIVITCVKKVCLCLNFYLSHISCIVTFFISAIFKPTVILACRWNENNRQIDCWIRTH